MKNWGLGPIPIPSNFIIKLFFNIYYFTIINFFIR